MTNSSSAASGGGGGANRQSRAIELLTPAEMGEADRLTIAGGTPGIVLMENAGKAVAAVAMRLVRPGSRIAVLAGPGNNGGDGFVAARLLTVAGYQAVVSLFGELSRLKGDAALAAKAWTGSTLPAKPNLAGDADLVIDALFGAGLDREIAAEAATLIDAVNRSHVPVIAVDLPSGISGLSGAVLGTAINATETVTFFRMKPGHLLLPGRLHTGPVTLADIGIDASTLDAIKPNVLHNVPELWLKEQPRPEVDGHKYARGHCVVVSGPMTRTGAARLAARGALRVGAGLVTVASPPDALAANAAHLTAIMLRRMDGPDGLAAILADNRLNAVVIGPALGVGDDTIALVEAALASEAALVIDADGITSFAHAPERLFLTIAERKGPVALTPHDGEFARLFPDLAEFPSRLDRARSAAKRSGAAVILKGPDTVVARPDGGAAISDNAPPDLATAGSGDVLAGLVGGLLAQRMPAFEAASAAVWLHGEAAKATGRGLIAEDLPEALPGVFRGLAR